jgi:hypothetical protein
VKRFQQFDKRIDLIAVSRRLENQFVVRYIDNLGSKDIDKIQNLLPLGAARRVDIDKRHFALNMLKARYRLSFANPCEPGALFQDLLDDAAIAFGNYRAP